MANIKFSAFTQKVAQADVDFLVGYTGADNVRIAPSTLGDGIYLPLAGGTMTGDIILNDDVRLRAGTGSDFSFFHNGSNSKINNNTGNIEIENFQDDGDIIFKSDDGSGGTTEYFRVDGSSEIVLFSKILRLQDNVRLDVGGGTDGRFYHDGTDTILTTITGDLQIKNSNDDGDIIFKSDDGSGGTTEYFKLDGTNTRLLVSKPLNLKDDVVLQLGNSQDLRIYHDGNNSYITEQGVGNLFIEASDNIYFRNAAQNEYFAQFTVNGACNFRYDNVVKLETTSGGIQVTDEVSIGTSIIHTGDTDTKISFGTDEIVLTTAGTDRVTVKPDGKVGIGLLTGLAKELEVEGNIRTRQSGGTTAAEIDITSGATWRFRSNPTSGTNSYGLDIIKGSAGTDIKMSIDTNGNVGIGTTAPATKLHVSSADNQLARFESTDAYGGIEICDNTSGAAKPLISALGNAFIFYNGGGSHTEALRIDSSQNATFAGDIEVENSTDGLILESPDGTRYRVTVANGGTLSVSAV
jgi:hypothetical protein